MQPSIQKQVVLLALSAAMTSPASSQTTTPDRLSAKSDRVLQALVDQSAQRLPGQHNTLGGALFASGDFTGDGRPDVVATLPGGGVELWVTSPSQRLDDETVFRILPPSHPMGTPVLWDVDRDGDLDLFLPSQDPSGTHPDRFYRNNGSGRFTIGPALPTFSQLTAGAAFGDVNGDGHPDLVLAKGVAGHNTGGGADQLLLGDGRFGFQPQFPFSGAPWNDTTSATTSANLGDLDGDGDLDLFLTKYDSASGSPGAQNILLLGDGAGQFSDHSQSRLLPQRRTDNSAAATFADLDNDGDLDMVVSNNLLSVAGPQSGDVYWNQGGAQQGTAGFFVDGIGDLPELPSPAEAIRLGQLVSDFDGDGLLDILFLVHDLPPGGMQPLFLGRPGGTFARARWFQTSSFIGGSAVALDMDGDGDPELLLSAAGSATGAAGASRTRLFWNL